MKEIDAKDLNKYLDVMEIIKKPAIALASDGKQTNGLTIGWASFGVLWNKYTSTVYVHKVRYSKHIFDQAEYYAICYFDEKYADIIKYFGTVSGRDENKIEKCGLEVIEDLAPYFAASKLVIISRVMGKSEFDINNVDQSVQQWYQRDGVHSQYYGEIVKILVND